VIAKEEGRELAKIEMVTRLKTLVNEVFSYIADFRTLQDYNSSVVRVDPIGDGPPAVGGRYGITMSMFGRSIWPVLNITEMKENELIATRLDAFIPAIEKRLFAASGNETEFSFTIEFSSKLPLLGPLIDAMLVRLFAGRQAQTEIRLPEKHFDQEHEQSRQRKENR
jgi:hypothetical protein